MKNRIISILMILGILLSVPVSFAENKSLPDGEKAYEILTSLGILNEEEDLYKPGEKVERGEIVKLITKVCGLPPLDGEPAFLDVDKESAENKYIRAAFENGLVHGDESGYFYPYEPATEGHLLKMAVTALGYDYLAGVKGGWQTGYSDIAKRTGLIDGLQLNMNQEATYEFAMVMLLNLAEAELMEAVGFSGDSTSMATTEGRNLLAKVHDIYIKEDIIVEATPYTHLLASDSGILKGRIVAGGKEYINATDNAVSLIGQNVRLYYHEDAESPATLLHISGYEKHNKLLRLMARDVISADFNGLKYREEDESFDTVSFSENVTPLLNGKLTAFDDKLLKFEIGDVTLIDNNGDNRYDIINVMNYSNHTVSGVNTTNAIVAMKDGSRIELDSEADDYDVVFIKNGNTVDIGAINEGDVISVAESDMKKGTGLKTVLISDTRVSGKLLEVLEETVIIDGEEIYARDAFFKNARAGREGTFMLDAFGYVCSIEEALDIVYGYLKHMYKDDSENVWCRIFTENGNWVELKFRERVRFNGSNEPYDKVYEAIGGENKDTYRQLIRYLVNNSSEITTLDTAKSVTIGSKEEEEAIDNNTFRMAYNGSLMFRNHYSTFNGMLIVDDNTKIFDIPTDSRADEDKYHIVSVADLNDDESYQIKAYDLDDMTLAKAVVTTVAPGGINASSRFMVVYSQKKILDKDDNTVDAVKGYWNGTECTIPVKLAQGSDVSNISDLSKGDIIQLTLDAEGNIARIRNHPYSSGYYLRSSLYSFNTTIAGKVKNTDFAKNIFLLTYQATGETAVLQVVKNVRVTVYDSAEGKCYPGTVNDIIKGDTVMASMHQLVAQELIVIR